jgi:hypothetical protein
MAEWNPEQAMRRYAQLMQLIHAGAYSDGDETEQAVLDLDYTAAQHGLAFHYHKEEDRYSLEPISAENKAAFLHVNVENLLSVLAEASRYLVSMPYESELDKSYRTGLHERIGQVIHESYRVPVLRDEPPEKESDAPWTGDFGSMHS